LWVYQPIRRWKHQNRFFESPPMVGFQKTDFYNENYCFVKQQDTIHLSA
jgi:hypothetical protein